MATTPVWKMQERRIPSGGGGGDVVVRKAEFDSFYFLDSKHHKFCLLPPTYGNFKRNFKEIFQKFTFGSFSARRLDLMNTTINYLYSKASCVYHVRVIQERDRPNIHK
jgi:hypothetical protein